jgi:hypothetical protein
LGPIPLQVQEFFDAGPDEDVVAAARALDETERTQQRAEVVEVDVRISTALQDALQGFSLRDMPLTG